MNALEQAKKLAADLEVLMLNKDEFSAARAAGCADAAKELFIRLTLPFLLADLRGRETFTDELTSRIDEVCEATRNDFLTTAAQTVILSLLSPELNRAEKEAKEQANAVLDELMKGSK